MSSWKISQMVAPVVCQLEQGPLVHLFSLACALFLSLTLAVTLQPSEASVKLSLNGVFIFRLVFLWLRDRKQIQLCEWKRC